MNKSKRLILTGSILLFIGLLLAFFSNYYNLQVMGKTSLGVGIFAPPENSAEWNRKETLRKISDISFYFGIFITAVGIALQTAGSLTSK
ncbi:MAG: hypothetical protein KJ887_04530 [Candidatus Omnitrophica bacterium]|nr:hypothetical protein [Candidatus Omnitrophota bacterium]MBU1047583.1 hypothetical protein [Candidatus Omnitrophota bacterium]MBU1631127.1 hypothetical protein [Candidatus Omnitrophota bacterium]MBU1766704.1 hypothetical protein [Candidatus Omnitrophota bacterium]MBU1888946.1 hypothetical protein [Candidatus Omnitrophota bacterium]